MRKVIILFAFFLPAISFAQTYGPNILTGGTATAETEYNATFSADKAVDGNDATRWASTDNTLPEWWKYDLGTSTTKTIEKIRMFVYSDVDGGSPKDFTIQGSNNNIDWTDIATTTAANSNSYQNFEFTNLNAYRYYRINITSDYRATDNFESFWEILGYEDISSTTTSTVTFSTTTDAILGTFFNFLTVGFVIFFMALVAWIIKKFIVKD